jgi:hypothetical protein
MVNLAVILGDPPLAVALGKTEVYVTEVREIIHGQLIPRPIPLQLQGWKSAGSQPWWGLG